VVNIAFYDFAVFDLSPLTVHINCSFFYIFITSNCWFNMSGRYAKRILKYILYCTDRYNCQL